MPIFLPIALKEANIKVYASVLMNTSVSLDEKAVALTELYNFFNETYTNKKAYESFGLGVYYRDKASGDIKTTQVPAPLVP
jgi:hypothetical protein